MQQRQAQGEQGLLSKQVTAELAAIGQQRFQAQRSHGRAATGGLHCEKFPSPRPDLDLADCGGVLPSRIARSYLEILKRSKTMVSDEPHA